MNPETTRTVFSAAHFIYIPLCIVVGLFVGWVFGARGSRAEVVRLRRLLEEQEEQAAASRLAKLERSKDASA